MVDQLFRIFLLIPYTASYLWLRHAKKKKKRQIDSFSRQNTVQFPQADCSSRLFLTTHSVMKSVSTQTQSLTRRLSYPAICHVLPVRIVKMAPPVLSDLTIISIEIGDGASFRNVFLFPLLPSHWLHLTLGLTCIVLSDFGGSSKGWRLMHRKGCAWTLSVGNSIERLCFKLSTFFLTFSRVACLQ